MNLKKKAENIGFNTGNDGPISEKPYD